MLSPARGKTKFFLSTSCIFGFAQDRMRLGTIKMKTSFFPFGFALGFHYF